MKEPVIVKVMIHMGDEDRKVVSSNAARDHHHHRTTQPTKRSPQKTPFTDTLHGKAPRLLRRSPFYPVPSLGSVFNVQEPPLRGGSCPRWPSGLGEGFSFRPFLLGPDFREPAFPSGLLFGADNGLRRRVRVTPCAASQQRAEAPSPTSPHVTSP
jgi:hypothetical protein